MPSIDEIIQTAMNSKELNSIDPGDSDDSVEEKTASSKTEVSEAEKIATILESLSEDDSILNSSEEEKENEKTAEETKEEESERTAEEKYMEKMAVGATIVDTLRSLDEKGISEKAFKKHFQEIKNGN